MMTASRITNFFLRPAVEADLPELEAVILSAIAGTARPDDLQAAILAAAQAAARALVPRGAFYIAQIAEDVVGCGGWSLGPIPNSGAFIPPVAMADNAIIHALCVKPHWWRRGIGRQIMKTCELAAARAGAASIAVAVLPLGEKLLTTHHYRLTTVGEAGEGLPMSWFYKPLTPAAR